MNTIEQHRQSLLSVSSMLTYKGPKSLVPEISISHCADPWLTDADADVMVNEIIQATRNSVPQLLPFEARLFLDYASQHNREMLKTC
jgi:hypothetical protein